jgi:sulfide:quinone oxidoreductase
VHRIVIAGAGFGGIATAAALRRELTPAEAEVVLIDRRDDFVMGLRKTWVIMGAAALDEGRRRLTDIRDIEVVRGEIERVDTSGRSVTVAGRDISGDSLVLALGARQAPENVPGLAEYGINAWDRDQAERARQAVAGLTAGRLVVGIFGMPYACPPAPFELALLARDRLPSAVEVVVFSPAPLALPVLGQTESAKVERLLTDRGIDFMTGHQAAHVERGAVHFADGTSLGFDALLAVPVHVCPQVLLDAGLAQPGGWIKPDPRTLEIDQPGVYAIGDCTVIPLANGLALPKAGIFAQLEGEVVAARIAARIAGREPTATFAGEGYCYLETGAGEAARASGTFMSDPVAVTISEPTSAAVDDKYEFESSRLAAWFGE